MIKRHNYSPHRSRVAHPGLFNWHMWHKPVKFRGYRKWFPFVRIHGGAKMSTARHQAQPWVRRFMFRIKTIGGTYALLMADREGRI